MPGFADFLQQLHAQRKQAELDEMNAAIAQGRAFRPAPSHADMPPDVGARSKTIAINGGRVAEQDVLGMTAPDFADTMARVPYQMEGLQADAEMARLMRSIYATDTEGLGPNEMRIPPADVQSEMNAVVGDPHERIHRLPAAPYGSRPATAGEFQTGPGGHPVEQAFGGLDNTVNTHGPERTYAAMAKNHPDPHEFARLLAGQLAARRMRFLGDQDPAHYDSGVQADGTIVLDPLLLSADPGARL
jgi:hypothetical protein